MHTLNQNTYLVTYMHIYVPKHTLEQYRQHFAVYHLEMHYEMKSDIHFNATIIRLTHTTLKGEEENLSV